MFIVGQPTPNHTRRRAYDAIVLEYGTNARAFHIQPILAIKNSASATEIRNDPRDCFRWTRGRSRTTLIDL